MWLPQYWWCQEWETILDQKDQEGIKGQLQCFSHYDDIIHPGQHLTSTEEAIMTIGESLHGKYKIWDMVWKKCPNTH